jgi:hypothetical protein
MSAADLAHGSVPPSWHLTNSPDAQDYPAAAVAPKGMSGWFTWNAASSGSQSDPCSVHHGPHGFLQALGAPQRVFPRACAPFIPEAPPPAPVLPDS